MNEEQKEMKRDGRRWAGMMEGGKREREEGKAKREGGKKRIYRVFIKYCVIP